MPRSRLLRRPPLGPTVPAGCAPSAGTIFPGRQRPLDGRPGDAEGHGDAPHGAPFLGQGDRLVDVGGLHALRVAPAPPLRLDALPGGGDALVRGQALHLRRPGHHRDDHLGVGPLELEAVGGAHHLGGVRPELLERAQGGATESVYY